jgi:hypothetical protein
MFRTRPLMIPRPRVRRAAALAEVGLEVSLMPSAALGMESLPPMMKAARCLKGTWRCSTAGAMIYNVSRSVVGMV